MCRSVLLSWYKKCPVESETIAGGNGLDFDGAARRPLQGAELRRREPPVVLDEEARRVPTVRGT
jgi:hypothetical protein